MLNPINDMLYFGMKIDLHCTVSVFGGKRVQSQPRIRATGCKVCKRTIHIDNKTQNNCDKFELSGNPIKPIFEPLNEVYDSKSRLLRF